MDESPDRRIAEDDRRSDAYVLNALLVEARAELVVTKAAAAHYHAALLQVEGVLALGRIGSRKLALSVIRRALNPKGTAE